MCHWWIYNGGNGRQPSHDLESVLDQDLEVMEYEASHPASLLGKIADSLPGLGIVAAVLGIIVTTNRRIRITLLFGEMK